MADWKQIVTHDIPYEGGLSREPLSVDPAAAYPAPYSDKYPQHNGKGYHTNKGVTWKTFADPRTAKKAGYIPTANLFYEMPQNVFYAIIKSVFWDAIYGDQIKSQGVAESLFGGVWGGGGAVLNRDLQNFLVNHGYKISVDGAIGPQTVSAVNQFTRNKQNEIELITFLRDARLRYLRSLSNWSQNQHGWTRRVNDYFSRGLSWVGKNPIKTTVFALLLIAGAAVYSGAIKLPTNIVNG